MSRILHIERDKFAYSNSGYQYLEASNVYGYTVSNSDPTVIKNILNTTFNSSNVESGLMPPGVRAIFPGVVIFERPPTMKLVQHINKSVEQLDMHIDDLQYDDEEEAYYDYDGNQVDPQDYLDKSPKDYYIPIPWQLYIATYTTNSNSKYYVNSIRMFFMNSPLHSSNVELYAPYIPNFYCNGVLCNPMIDSFDEIDRYPKNISGVIASAYDWIWNSGFNDDLNETVKLTVNSSPASDQIFDQETKRSFRFTDNFVGKFYNYISDIPLEEINSYTWLNPSYSSHFSADVQTDYVKKKYFDLFKEQVKDNEEIEKDNIHSIYYKEWLINNMYSFKKTYKDVLDHLFYSTFPFNSLLNQNFNLFSSIDNIADSLVSSISVHNSI
jgi:hypothetical protein